MKPVKDLREYIGREDELVGSAGKEIFKIVEKPSLKNHRMLVILGDGSYYETDVQGFYGEHYKLGVYIKEKLKVKKTFWRRKWYIDSSGMLDREHEFAPTKEKFDERSKYAAGTWSDEWESITIEVEE